MVANAKKVLADALELPREERTEVVDRLLLSLDDEEDQLEDDDRKRLHAAIERSEEQFSAGEGIPAEVALDRLRKR